MDEAVRTTGLTKDYGGVGVFHLDLTVPRGVVFGFLGPNGAGKTTVMRMLMGFTAPHAGQALVLGLDPRTHGPQVRAGVGFLPSELSMDKRVTGRRLLAHLAALRGGVDRPYLEALCARFAVDLDRPVRTLSTGNRRKLGLVQAFMHRPSLLVLDEPTSGLDPLVQQEFHALLRETTAEGRTVLLSSHTLSEVEQVAEVVAVLRLGRLVAVQDVAGLRTRARRRVTAQLVPDPCAAEYADLPGVKEVQVTGARLSLVVEGEVDAVVKALARSRVLSLDVDEGDLEQTFLGYYGAAAAYPEADAPRAEVTA